MPGTPSPGALPPARRRVRPPRAEADPRNWSFGAKYAYRPEATTRPSLAFSASSPEVLQTVSPSFAFGAHDWRLATTSGLRHSLVERLPKKTPIPSKIVQNAFGFKSLFVDESVMSTQFVALKLQTQKQLAFAEGKLKQRRSLLEEDRFQLFAAEAEFGVVEESMKQKAAEAALAEAARKEEERRKLERERALRDARENARQIMEDKKQQSIEAQAAYFQQRSVLESALLEKKKLQQELHMTHSLEMGQARQRQVRIHTIIKQIESRPKDLPWAAPAFSSHHSNPKVDAEQLVASEEQRQKGRNALQVAKKAIAADSRRLTLLGRELAQLSRQSSDELYQVTDNIAALDEYCEALAAQTAAAEKQFLVAVDASDKAIRAHELISDDLTAEEAMQALNEPEQAPEEDAPQGELIEAESLASWQEEERRGSKSSKSSHQSKTSKVPVTVSVDL